MSALLKHSVLALLLIAQAPSLNVTHTATCYVQGSLATVSINVLMMAEYVELPVLGNLLAIVNTSGGAFVSYQGRHLEVLAPNIPANITVTYLTELFEYTNEGYVAEFYNPYRTLTLYLPPNALIIEVSNLTHFRRTSDSYELVFSEGHVKVAYIFVETKVERVGWPGWTWMIVAGAVGGAGASAYVLYTRRRMKSEKLGALDERDRTIINALKSGPLTPQELIKITDMSKATFYRRIRRLMSMGYVEQIKKEGKVYYRLRKASGS